MGRVEVLHGFLPGARDVSAQPLRDPSVAPQGGHSGRRDLADRAGRCAGSALHHHDPGRTVAGGHGRGRGAGVSNETLGLIQLALLSLAIFIGFPTAFTLLALGFVFGYVGFGHLVFDMMVQRAFFVMSNDVLISIVLFVFMGYVAERSGILDRLVPTILHIYGPLRGSLALSTVITCTIFAMATGIIGASVTLMGLLALPRMLKVGEDQGLASGGRRPRRRRDLVRLVR